MRRTRRWRPYPVDETCKLYLPFYKYGAEQTKILDISTSHNDGTISGSVPVAYPMIIPIASGTVTLANMRISAVNGGTTASGGAFVDFSAANVLTDYLDHFLVIKDSSNRAIQGIIKAAGTAETYLDLIGGTNPALLNGDFASAEPPGVVWTRGVGWTVAGGVGVFAPGATDVISQVPGLINYALYKMTFTIVSISGDGAYFRTNLPGVGNGPAHYATGTYTDYMNSKTGTSVGIAGYSTTTGTIANLSLQKTLTPGSTGVTIVNSKGGVTYNWVAKDASFNYNDSSNYTYAIYSIPSYTGLGWFADGTDDRIVHTSLNLGTTHTFHYWVLYQGISGVIHGGASTYHGMRLSPTACGYRVGGAEVTVTHSATFGEPVLFSIDRSGTSVDFYKNGVKIGTTQTLDANTAQVLTDLFRYSNGTSYWNGIIFDAVNINTNKGAQEIRNFFEMTRSVYGV